MVAARQTESVTIGDMTLSAITPADYEPLLALNNRYKKETSLLNAPQWQQLVEQTSFARQFEPHLGFLLCVASSQNFSNTNFLWFKERYQSFVYVDRIVVSEAAQGKGAGRALYESLFDYARNTGHKSITCEVNKLPPNPGSDAFHKRMGFEPVATVTLANPETGKEKTVRYMIKDL